MNRSYFYIFAIILLGLFAIQTHANDIRSRNYINQVSVNFCEGSNEHFTTLGQGEKETICINLSNQSTSDLSFWINFAEQEVSNMGNRACNAKYDTISQFIDFDEENPSAIKVSAGETLQTQFSIQFPFGINGLQRGCVAYGVNQDMEDSGGMVSIISRKVIYFEALVGMIGDLEHEIKFNKIEKNINNIGELELNIKGTNIGNIDSSIKITGNISDYFGFYREFEFDQQTVEINHTREFSQKIGFLPSYKGLFNIELNIEHEPSFRFNIDNFDLDEDVLKAKKLTIRSYFFQMPRTTFIIALLIILLLLNIFIKTKKSPKQ